MTRRLKNPMKAPGAYSTREPTDANQILLGGVSSVRSAAARTLGLASASAATPEQRQARASKGGKASSRALTKAQRSARARKASRARWAKVKK